MSESLFKHAFRRIMFMPKCSDVQLNYEINTISNKLSYQKTCCEDAKPNCNQSIASLATI